ncbi:MAG TPA: hypothetical protein VMB26_14470 [Candidatus Binataceae bacterium]|nr:hypothetical protein [Candidatus Binataceae bacterium]
MAIQADSNIEVFVGEILASAPASGASQLTSWQKPEKSFRRLLRRDYVRDLRRNLNYRQLLALVDSADAILPRLNREPLGVMPVKQQAQLAANLGLHFKAAPRKGTEGLALRGFYVDKLQQVLQRPLIYVNTAHHPVAVSTTFCHELGHHLAADILRPREQKVHLFFDVDYSDHLNDPSELTADVLVSLAGYPRPVAEKIFSRSNGLGLVASTRNLTDNAFAEIHSHLKQVYGVDLRAGVSPRQRLNYLSGMVHYAKLRWALLAEYDV